MNKLAALALVAFVAFTTGCASTTSSASINFAIAEKSTGTAKSVSFIDTQADPSDPTSWTVTEQNVTTRWHAPDTTVPATRAAATRAAKVPGYVGH